MPNLSPLYGIAFISAFGLFMTLIGLTNRHDSYDEPDESEQQARLKAIRLRRLDLQEFAQLDHFALLSHIDVTAGLSPVNSTPAQTKSDEWAKKTL